MNINEARSAIRSAFIDWEGFLVNNRDCKNGSTLSWENYAPKRFSPVVTAFEVFELIEMAQYTFQVALDGSIFQIYYLYDGRGRVIQEASLSFLMSGVEVFHDGEEELAIQPSPDAPVGWLRIDYSNKNENDGGVNHPKCHLHISLLPNARIPVDRIPNPKQFVEFVIANFYPEVYKSKRLNDTGRYNSIEKMCNINTPLPNDISMSDVCEHSFHLKLPCRLAAPPALPVVRPGTRRK